MSPPSTPPSKRRLADQRPASLRKRQRTHVPLAQAFLRQDFGFPPPPGLRHLDSSPRRAITDLPRPTNPNGRDPFQHLGDDEVYVIISNLSAKDTETLRRVSKFWKATSEYHCGKSTLIQQLPWAASQDLDGLSKEDVNLQYRRQLYHYESLQLGLATRAIKFDGVYDWHLNGNALIWSNGYDKASIRVLKAPNGTPLFSEDEVVQFDRSIPPYRSMQPFYEIPYVQLTKTGDLIVLFRSYIPDANGHETIEDPSQYRCPRSIDVLTKMTTDGVQWQLLLRGSICKPAIGKDAVYFMEARPEGQFCGDHGPAFKKVSLATGIVSYSTFPPEINETGVFVRRDQEDNATSSGHSKVQTPTPGRKIQVAKLDTSLKLAGNETLAVWSDLNQRIHIFSTANGQILFTYNRQDHTTLAVSAIKPQIWDICSRPDIPGIDAVRLTTYDVRTEALTYSFTSGEKRAQQAAPRFLDADRPVAFDLCHSMNILDDKTRDPFTTMEIVGLEKTISEDRITLGDVVRPEKVEDDSEESTFVTLPPKPGQGNKRRVLELEAPWMVGKDDFFGLVDGYLIYHNLADKELIVVDFWPNW